jgi:hypothetical protein
MKADLEVVQFMPMGSRDLTIRDLVILPQSSNLQKTCLPKAGFGVKTCVK